MQRIYGACFYTQQELDDYLHKLEEAKRRDHRRSGGAGSVFDSGGGRARADFLASEGGLIRKLMEDWLRDELLRRGYDLVYTPHISAWICGRPAATRIFIARICSARWKSKKPSTS